MLRNCCNTMQKIVLFCPLILPSFLKLLFNYLNKFCYFLFPVSNFLSRQEFYLKNGDDSSQGSLLLSLFLFTSCCVCPDETNWNHKAPPLLLVLCGPFRDNHKGVTLVWVPLLSSQISITCWLSWTRGATEELYSSDSMLAVLCIMLQCICTVLHVWFVVCFSSKESLSLLTTEKPSYQQVKKKIDLC